jgi:HMG-box domain
MRDTKDEWLEKNRPTHDLSKGSIFSAMTKAIAHHWKTLSSDEADKYHKLAAQDSKRYKDEMEQYHTAEARMRRLTEGLVGKERVAAIGGGGGGETKSPPGATKEDSSVPSMIDTSHTSRADSASRGPHGGGDPLAGLYQHGSLPTSTVQGYLSQQGGAYQLLGLGGASQLGLEYGGGESIAPWSQSPAAAVSASAWAAASQQDLLVHDYLVEQQLQQRYADQQRLMDQQRLAMAAEQRFMDQRALDQLYLEQRLRQQQQMQQRQQQQQLQAPQLLVPAYPTTQAATLYYPSDPRLGSGGSMFLGNVGLATSAATAAPAAVHQPVFLYAPSQQQQVISSSMDGSLSGSGAVVGIGTHQHRQQQQQQSIRHEILHSLAAENAQQQALQQLQGLSSLPPHCWASSTVAAAAPLPPSSLFSDRDRSPALSIGVGSGGAGAGDAGIVARASVESETSRRLVRNLLQRPPPPFPSEDAREEATTGTATTTTDESERSRSQSARGERRRK